MEKNQIKLSVALEDSSINKFICDRGFTFTRSDKYPDTFYFITEDDTEDETTSEYLAHWGIEYVYKLG